MVLLKILTVMYLRKFPALLLPDGLSYFISGFSQFFGIPTCYFVSNFTTVFTG